MEEVALMQELQRRLGGSAVQMHLQAIAAELLQALQADPAKPKSTFRAIPLPLYGDVLLPAIGSSWIFVLRGCLAHPPERHPNSVQRMFALAHPGRFDWWEGDRWQSRLLLPGGEGLSIPADTWHRMPAQDDDWAVVSFHTVDADQLVEIVGEPETGEVTSSRSYVPAN